MPIIQEIQCVCMCMHFYACGTCNTDSAIYQPIAFILVVPHSFFVCKTIECTVSYVPIPTCNFQGKRRGYNRTSSIRRGMVSTTSMYYFDHILFV